MSEYIPTTREVRNRAYQWRNRMSYTPTTEEVAEIYFQSGYMTTPEQFDRWLAEVKAQERKADRQSIIKRLAGSHDRTILTAIVDLIEGEEQ